LLSVLALRLTMETRECRSAMIGIIFAFTLWNVALAVDCEWINYGAHASLIAAAGRLIGQVTLLLSIGLYARHVLFDAEGLLPQRELKPPREKKVKKQKSGENDAETGRSTKIDTAHKTSDKRTDLQPHTSVAQPIGRGPLAGRVASVSSSSATTSSANSNRSRVEEDEEDDRDSSHHNRDYDEEDDDDYNGGGRKLSRAERKRLRKMQRQQHEHD
jgi:hypothetical protein